MLLTPTNRQFQGLTVRVIDPETGRYIEKDEIIDLETLDYDKKNHYLSILKDGDLTEVSSRQSSVVPSAKQNKGE